MNTPPPIPTDTRLVSPQKKSGWLLAYAIVSSAIVVVLLFGFLLRHSTPSQESIVDLKERTAEYEKQEKMRAGEAKRRAAMARLQGLEGQLAILRQSLVATQSEKAAYSTKIRDYALDHKLAIAAMGITVGGAGVATDGSGRFTDDQKTVAGIGAGIAGLYALANYEECAEVADRMAKAAAIQSDFDRRIKSTEKQIAALKAEIDSERKQLEK